jgi:hypothetical protein
MAYRFKQGRSIERDVRRVAEKQLAAAIAETRDFDTSFRVDRSARRAEA